MLILVCGSPAGAAGSADRAATQDGTTATAADDTLRVYHHHGILVTAPRPSLIAEPGVTEVPAPVLDALGSGWAEAIGAVVPATRVGINSRGEALFNVRGAYERHVPIYLDGVPLTVPWDERVDVTMIPTGAVGTVTVVRGAGSVHDGPNNLGGVVILRSQELEADGNRTVLQVRGGQDRLASGSAVHLRRAGAWSVLASAERRTRDHFLLPEGFAAPHNQPDERPRRNSDLRQTALLVRLSRRTEGGGSVGGFLSAAQAARGVPAETHLAPEEGPRYWRIPRWDRWLGAIQADIFPEWTRTWRLQTALSWDEVRQEIQGYPDSTYAAPPEVLARDLESDRDRTGMVRARLSRPLFGDGEISLGGNARYTRHAETLEEGGDEETYAQFLAGLAAEWEGALARDLSARLGVGYDLVTTPETGDKPARDTDGAAAATGRLSREIGPRAQVHLTASRRTRFASLRELYSGALGRFLPNPDLRPESQESYELGGGYRTDVLGLAGSAFLQFLHDGIERIQVTPVPPDSVSRFQRVNLTEIRTAGAEISLYWRPRRAWRIDAQHAVIDARARPVGEGGETRSERRPSYLSHAAVTLELPARLEALASVQATGTSYSLDARTGRLARVAPFSTIDVRLSWGRSFPDRGLRAMEIWGRVSNLFDTIGYSQLGLPEPGRQFQAGLRIDL